MSTKKESKPKRDRKPKTNATAPKPAAKEKPKPAPVAGGLAGAADRMVSAADVAKRATDAKRAALALFGVSQGKVKRAAWDAFRYARAAEKAAEAEELAAFKALSGAMGQTDMFDPEAGKPTKIAGEQRPLPLDSDGVAVTSGTATSSPVPF